MIKRLSWMRIAGTPTARCLSRPASYERIGRALPALPPEHIPQQVGGAECVCASIRAPKRLT